MTALLAVMVEGKVPTRREAAALAVLCAGVMLTVWEGLAGSAAGILLCLAGTVRLPPPKLLVAGTGYLLRCSHQEGGLC